MLNLLILFILGSAVGSFLNVCIHRLPRGESIVFPPSHCPNCNSAIKVLDLVPLFGYFFLDGKCRDCKQPISPRYPMVELLSGIAFPVVWLFSGADFFSFILQIIFILLCLLIFFTDLEQQLIPDGAWIIGIIAGLSYNFNWSAVAGMLLGFFLLFSIGWLGKWWYKKEAMGEGDYFIGAFLGAFLGWQGVLLSIFAAYLIAAAVAVVLLLSKKSKFGEYIPFGPALVGGGIIAFFFGPAVIKWYLGIFL